MAVYRADVTPGMRWGVLGPQGQAYAGYYLFTTLAGAASPISNPQGTFTTGAGLTLNANPIVLDANGGLEAAGPAGSAIDIWLSGGVAYKFWLTDNSAGGGLPGNILWTRDNLTGINDPAFASNGTTEFVSAPALTWISSAAQINGTVATAQGSQLSIYQPNRRILLQTAGPITQYGRIASATVAGGLTTVTIDMDAAPATGIVPVVANPIAAAQVAIEGAGGVNGPGVGLPSAAIALGQRRSPSDGSGRTGTDLYGPIGSNLRAIQFPPALTANITSFNTSTGLITWTSAPGFVSGLPYQWSGTTPPGNLAKATTYIYFAASGTTGYFYAPPAGWIDEMLPYIPPVGGGSGAGTGGNDALGGGLVWAAPAGTGSSSTGSAATCTPGWVAPPGVGRDYCKLAGGGGGGAGAAAVNSSAIASGTGGGSGGIQEGWQTVVSGTFYPAAVGVGGTGGVAGNNAGGNGGASTFNGYSGNGGTGGPANSTNFTAGGAGGTTNGAAILNLTGAQGGGSIVAVATAGLYQWVTSGKGAGSAFGDGAPSVQVIGTSAQTIAGVAAVVPGTGGSGAATMETGAAAAGGAGANGLIAISW